MLKSVLRLTLAALLALVTVLPAAAAYKIQAGDTLTLQVVEDSSLDRNLLVLPDGSINVPSVGTIRAAGDTVDNLRNIIATRLAPNFASKPTVYLSVAALKPMSPTASNGITGPTIDVYATGEVNKPGMVEVRKGTTLLQALAQVGGVTPYAATKRIQLRRTFSNGQVRVYRFDYRAAMAGVAAPALTLQEGDVILVPTRRLFELFE